MVGTALARLCPPTLQLPSRDTDGLRGIGPSVRGDDHSHHVSIFTYSKSPGLLSIPILGAKIQEASGPRSVTVVIKDAMNSPSEVEGTHSPLRLVQVASSIRMPSG